MLWDIRVFWKIKWRELAMCCLFLPSVWSIRTSGPGLYNIHPENATDKGLSRSIFFRWSIENQYSVWENIRVRNFQDCKSRKTEVMAEYESNADGNRKWQKPIQSVNVWDGFRMPINKELGSFCHWIRTEFTGSNRWLENVLKRHQLWSKNGLQKRSSKPGVCPVWQVIFRECWKMRIQQ